MKDFGGEWTEQKLKAFIKYVKAYLTILKKQKWQTIYFDGFAGYGNKTKEKSLDKYNLLTLFDLEEEVENIDVYEGSVQRILSLKEPHTFDYYYFIDSNEKYIKNLEETKSEIVHISQNRIIIRKDDCNNQIIKLADALKRKKYAALIFLDPFGMQVKWKVLENLRNTRSDLWILLPSGVAINRLLDKDKKLKHKEKLMELFGLPIQEIEKEFYQEIESETIFGKEVKEEKIKNPINHIANLYIQQLRTIWKFVLEKPLILYNTKNCPIFHFIFASNNKVGLRIASDIIVKEQDNG
ncbi:MAG: three-Cys-motif partner protein TcmP [Candidatus Cloacimonetes bacterium]|nr:three-Cys-motif partner protein TcmP [Candidatus Cloacimonadota bacterium]